MKDLNRIKVVLVEKKEDEQMVGRTVREKYLDGEQVVYQHITA